MEKEKRVVYPGQKYRHFKNKLYQIVTVAEHSETGERLVIYQQLYGNFEVYARPYEMFVSEVDHVKYPEVSQKYRFELVETVSKDVQMRQSEQTSKDVQMRQSEQTSKDEQMRQSEQTSKDEQIRQPEQTIETAAVSIQKIKKDVYPDDAGFEETMLSQTNVVSANENEKEADEMEYGGVNPHLLRFLDAETYEDKRSVLISIKGEITDRLIDDIAASMDVTVDKGDLEERFGSLLTCLDTMVKFEVNRLR
ncbi:MAG: DUF1653 domain-containing protein [Lachnospiraceae bacterium]|nr:DUF1653 domain-containing protein [Lachnospiraceae bacterium]